MRIGKKNHIPVVILRAFAEKDFRFDTAIHWLNQYNENGMVCRLFDTLGNDYPRALQQTRIRKYKGDDYEYLLTSNPDELKEQWKKEFPDDAAGIEKFFKAAKKVGEAFDNFGHVFRSEETMNFWEKLRNKRNMLKFAMYFIPHLRYTGDKGVQKGLAKYFKSERLRKVFSADTEILSCIVPIGWAYFKDYQSPPKGGGQVIAEWLEHMIQYFDQETHYRYDVKQILTEGDTACGVLCIRNKKEYRIKSKYVIAACDAPALYDKLLPASLIPEKIKKNLQQAELYSSSVTVSIALDCTVEQLGFNEELVHISSAAVSREDHASGDPALSELSIIAPTFRDHSLAPEGCGTLMLYMPAYMKYEEEWRTEKDENGNMVRGTAYKELKESIAKRLIQRVEEKVAPGLQKHILFYEVATPVTHWRYTGNKDGSIMATKPNRPNMMKKVATYHTPVKNLLLGGHWAELGGGVPIAAKAGANAAMIILKKEKKSAYQVLADYVDGKISVEALHQSQEFAPYNGTWTQNPTPAQKKRLRQQNNSSIPEEEEIDGNA